MILAGALTGVAAAFKQVAAVNWFFLVALYPVLFTGGRRLRRTMSFAVWSAAGAALVWSIIIAYFFVRHGLTDLVYNVFTHNLEYIHAISWSQRLYYWRHTLATLGPALPLVGIFSAASFVALLAAGRMKLLLFLAGWMVSSLIGVCASGYFFPHYFQQLLPALSVTAALGAEALDDAGFSRKIPAWIRRSTLVALIVVLPVIVICPFIFSYSPEQAVGKIYPDNPFAEMRVFGNRVAQITRPDDRVFIFGAEPEVLFYAQRVSATRYIFLFPLYGPYSDALEKQIATANEISASRPAAALYLPNQLFFAPDSQQYFTQWSQLYLHNHFRIDTCLTSEPFGGVHVISGVNNQEPSIPAGQQIVGLLLVRTKDSRPQAEPPLP
jgi:hypothetical protein